MNKFQLKHEFGFGEINKDTNEFAYKMTLMLKDKCKNLSVFPITHLYISIAIFIPCPQRIEAKVINFKKF